MTEERLDLIRADIEAINATRYTITEGLAEEFGSEENLKVALSEYFTKRLRENDFSALLITDLEDVNFVKARIVEIANRHLIYKGDLIKFYDIEVLKNIKDSIDSNEYTNNTLSFFRESLNNDRKYNFLKGSIKKFIEKQFDFIFTNGFLHNSTNINRGIMTANAGDSAQFLFLSRAILAGYNCSNVDVRSSRCDAVIDYDNYILRIQVKGISSGNSISFKDRDRGGQGIDHRHERNIGRRITSLDCDIYVAVDRQVGTCYLIPMSYADALTEEQLTRVHLRDVQGYKENWSVIHDTVSALKGV